MNADDHLKFANHELRNALAPLVNYIEILKLQGADPATVAKMERQVAKLQADMDRLLLGKSDPAFPTSL